MAVTLTSLTVEVASAAVQATPVLDHRLVDDADSRLSTNGAGDEDGKKKHKAAQCSHCRGSVALAWRLRRVRIDGAFLAIVGIDIAAR